MAAVCAFLSRFDMLLESICSSRKDPGLCCYVRCVRVTSFLNEVSTWIVALDEMQYQPYLYL